MRPSHDSLDVVSRKAKAIERMSSAELRESVSRRLARNVILSLDMIERTLVRGIFEARRKRPVAGLVAAGARSAVSTLAGTGVFQEHASITATLPTPEELAAILDRAEALRDRIGALAHARIVNAQTKGTPGGGEAPDATRPGTDPSPHLNLSESSGVLGNLEISSDLPGEVALRELSSNSVFSEGVDSEQLKLRRGHQVTSSRRSGAEKIVREARMAAFIREAEDDFEHIRTLRRNGRKRVVSIVPEGMEGEEGGGGGEDSGDVVDGNQFLS